MKTITNSNGYEYSINQWDNIVNAMDDDVRERVHNELAPCTEQEFFTAYAKAHKTEFAETWELDKANPQW